MPNRYFTLQGTTFDDIPLITPDFEGVESLLSNQQKMYDVTKSLADKKPLHIKTHAPAVQNYITGVRSGIDQVSEAYANQGVQAGNKVRNELIKKVSRDWQPGGEAYGFEDVYNTYNTLSKKYSDKFIDDPNFMDQYAQMKLKSSIKEWDYDAETETYSNVVDPNVSEYVDIQKEIDAIIKGFDSDFVEEVSFDGRKIWTNGVDVITEADVTDMAKNLLGQERFQQQLDIEQWNKYGFDGKPSQEVIDKLTDAQRANMEEQFINNKLGIEGLMATKEGREDIQMMLNKKGLYDGKIDGIVGPKSQAALEEHYKSQRELIDNYKVGEDYYINQVKQEYINPMVQKYARTKRYQDVKYDDVYLAGVKANHQIRVNEAYIMDLTPPKVYDVASGATTKDSYTTLQDRKKDAEENLRAAKGNLLNGYDDEVVNAFFVKGANTSGESDGTLFGGFSNWWDNVINTADPYNSVSKALVTANTVDNELQAKGISKGDKDYDTEFIKAYVDTHDKGWDHSPQQLEDQARLLLNEDNYQKFTDDIITYEKAQFSKRSADEQIDRIASGFDNTEKGQEFWNNSYENYKNYIITPGINNVEDFRKAVKDGTIKVKGATSSNVEPDGIFTAVVGSLFGAEYDLESPPGRINNGEFIMNGYKKSVKDAWNEDPSKFNLNSRIVMFTGGDANKDFNKDMFDAVKTVGLENFKTLDGFSGHTLTQLGFDSSGNPTPGMELKSVNFGYAKVDGITKPVMQVSTTYGDGKKGYAVVPFSDIQGPMVSHTINQIYTSTLDAQGQVMPNEQTKQNNAIASIMTFDNEIGKNSNINDTYLFNNKLKKGQVSSVGYFNMNVGNSTQKIHVIRSKPNSNVIDDYSKDQFYTLSNEESKRYNSLPPEKKSTYLSSIPKSRKYESWDAMKEKFGRLLADRNARENVVISSGTSEFRDPFIKDYNPNVRP